jgi:uncharacterized protein (UPF0333 family)
MTSKQWIILIVVAVVFAGGGFFGGIKYQQSKTPAAGARAFNAAGTAGFALRRGAGGAGGTNAGFANGQVLNVDQGSITIKLQNGGSQNVVLAPSTQYRKAVDGTSADVIVGSQVTITGTTNSDGSLTAQSVQIRPASSTPEGLPAK